MKATIEIASATATRSLLHTIISKMLKKIPDVYRFSVKIDIEDEDDKA